MRKFNKILRIEGEVPFFYKQNTIYVICVTINALVDAVNALVTEVKNLEDKINSIKESD